MKETAFFNPIEELTSQLKTKIGQAIDSCKKQAIFPDEELSVVHMEIPSDPSLGDFTTNIAMISAKALKLPPRKIAEAVCAAIDLSSLPIDNIEVAGPGFINFKVNPIWFASIIQGILDAEHTYGRSSIGQGKKVNVEYVSANPTGPMHMGNARGGALGDGIAAALEYTGHEVTREFYVNDAGNQIAKFGMSLEVRYLQLLNGFDSLEFPEDGYQGDDITELAQRYLDEHGDHLLTMESVERRKILSDYAVPINVANLKEDLTRYRVLYDCWFPESHLHESRAVEETIEKLKESGLTYEKDGALWLKNTEEGEDEKDDVLVRANGFPTYFTADIAYHYNKFVVRGFDKAIDVLGTDHHGHVARLKRAVAAMGYEGCLDIVLLQLVRLMKNGEVVRMSKRTGKAITLSDLLEDVPVDAARFFFNMREPNSHMDFDLDLAVKEDAENPVYYVQYAHARLCSILKNLAAEGIAARSCTSEELMLLNTPQEKELIRHMAMLPNVIIDAALQYSPAGITRYVMDLATKFHKFYSACKVKGSEESLLQARLALCVCCKTIFHNNLTMLKITAPEIM